MNNHTYINILINTLTKKDDLLDRIIQITLLQEECVDEQTFNMDQFDQIVEEKQPMIEQLNQLDDGFEQVYDHVKEEISNNKDQYKEEILVLQKLIKQVTEKSVNLQAIELRNKNKITLLFSRKKKEIKNFKMSKQTVTNYYKSMPSQHQGQSYFLDKKK